MDWGVLATFVLGLITLFCNKKNTKDEEATEKSGDTESWFSGVWEWLKSIGAVVSDQFTTTLYICPVCGHTHGTPFTTCPKCGATNVTPIVKEDVDVTSIMATVAGLTALVGGEDAADDLNDAFYDAARAAAEAALIPTVGGADGAVDAVKRSENLLLYALLAAGFFLFFMTGDDDSDEGMKGDLANESTF